MRVTTVILFVTALAAAPVGSATPPDRGLDTILNCRKERDATRRLACFDAAIGVLSTSIERKDVVVVDKGEVQAAKRSLFGFPLARLPIVGETESVDAIADTVAAARTDADGNWIVTLRGGSTWAQTDGQPIGRSPHPGDDVTIGKGALGSYFMKIGRQPGVRAKRLPTRAVAY